MENNNIPIITLENFIEIIKRQLSENNYRPIMGLGKGGIGKSKSMEELTQSLGIGYIDIRLLLYSETDLKGIPYPDEHHKNTIWLQNAILPDEERDGKHGILVLDEITSCAKSVRTAAYQLLNERKLGEYKLPDGWLIVCLGNGEEDGGDFEGMEGNFANRGSIYRIAVDVESWKTWAITHNVHPLVIGYINFQSADLHTYNEESDNNLLFASPRSWTAVSDIMKSSGGNMNDIITVLRISGNIGPVLAQRFKAFCNYKGTVDTSDIIERGMKYTPANTEVANITISSIINTITSEIERDISNNGGQLSEQTTRHIINAVNWFASLKAEWAIMAIKDFRRWNIDIVTQLLLNKTIQDGAPEFKVFLMKNREIFKDK